MPDQPELGDALGVAGVLGLAIGFGAQALIRDKRIDTLSLLPASQTRDKDALTEEGVEKVIDELREKFDWIVCDSPAGIDKGAMERILGIRDGGIDYKAFFNPDATTGVHARLSTLPTTDQIITYCRGTTLGSPAACLVAKQLNYDPKRGNSGEINFDVSSVANGYGLEWGQLLTAGKRTDTTATNGTTSAQTTVTLTVTP